MSKDEEGENREGPMREEIRKRGKKEEKEREKGSFAVTLSLFLKREWNSFHVKCSLPLQVLELFSSRVVLEKEEGERKKDERGRKKVKGMTDEKPFLNILNISLASSASFS